jgi:hypothetical protein
MKIAIPSGELLQHHQCSQLSPSFLFLMAEFGVRRQRNFPCGKMVQVQTCAPDKWDIFPDGKYFALAGKIIFYRTTY